MFPWPVVYCCAKLDDARPCPSSGRWLIGRGDGDGSDDESDDEKTPTQKTMTYGIAFGASF